MLRICRYLVEEVLDEEGDPVVIPVPVHQNHLKPEGGLAFSRVLFEIITYLFRPLSKENWLGFSAVVPSHIRLFE